MTVDQIGAIVESGPSDWQIVQRNASGTASISVRGRWVSDQSGTVELRLVSEDTSEPVSRALDWHAAQTADDRTWQADLERVPAGGLYRLETRFRQAGNPAGEWSQCGDTRHLLGVGDIWIIAGQSNAAGYGRGPVFDPPEQGVHAFRADETWSLATHPLADSTGTLHAVSRGGSIPGHSPFVHFGRLLMRELGFPIGLIPTALGGSGLAPWNPVESNSAVLFRNMMHCVERAGGRVKGILWYQGETDTQSGLAETYAERFVSAVGAWRAALNDPVLPILTVQLNRVLGPTDDQADRNWSLVREAQRQAARHLDNVAVVPTFDLPLSDNIHTSPHGNLLLAQRLASAALGLVYGRPVEYRAPDLQSARAIDGGRRIELKFEPVISRMGDVDPTSDCFRVEDRGGRVPVDGAVYPGDATVQLVLGRPIVGNAVVHGGYGACPASVPMDMERLTPMLGFYAARVAP